MNKQYAYNRYENSPSDNRNVEFPQNIITKPEPRNPDLVSKNTYERQMLRGFKRV